MKQCMRMLALPAAGMALLILLVLLAACGTTTSSNVGSAGQATTTPQGSASTPSPTTPPSSRIVAGSIEFYGTVRSVSASTIAVSMPDGQTLTMSIVSGKTDLSHNNNVVPTTGQFIEVEAATLADGSFVATQLARSDPNDQHDWAEIDYRGETTSAVGSDLVLHFQVGKMTFSFPISATADVSDFGNRVQSIGANQAIEAEVQFQATHGTVVEIDRR